MLSLNEAIEHVLEVSQRCDNKVCSIDHYQLYKWLTELKLRRKIEEDNRNDMAKILQERYDDFLYLDLTLMYKQLYILDNLITGQNVIHNIENCFCLCKTCENMSSHYFNSGHLECSSCCPLDMKICAYFRVSPIYRLKEKLRKNEKISNDIKQIKKIKLKNGWKLTTLNGRKVAVFVGTRTMLC